MEGLQGINRFHQTRLHVEDAGPKDLILGDIKGHFGDLTHGPNRIDMGQDKNLTLC